MYVGLEDQKSQGKGERKRDVCRVNLLIKAIEDYVLSSPPPPPGSLLCAEEETCQSPSQK